MATVSGRLILDRNRMIDIGNTEMANVAIVLQNVDPLPSVTVPTDANGNYKTVLPQSISFRVKTVNINGVSYATANPETGFMLPNIIGGDGVIIAFEAEVTSTPISNSTIMHYDDTSVQGDMPNTSSASIHTVNLSLDKTASIRSGQVGDIYTYVLSIRNTSDLTLSNVFVRDILPTELTYRDNLRKNGVVISGDITQGVTISTIDEDQIVRLTFDVEITSIPSDGQIVNHFTAQYGGVTQTSSEHIIPVQTGNADISVTKTASQSNVTIGVPFTYTIDVTNTGDVTLNEVFVTDELPESFNVTSISVNDKVVSGDITRGINIGTLVANESASVILTVVLGPDTTIQSYTNVAEAQGMASIGIRPIIVSGTDSSTIIIGTANPTICVEKSADKEYLALGEKVNFIIKIVNTGDIPLENVVVYDRLPKGLEFIDCSARINSIPGHRLDPRKGIKIGYLGEGQEAYVTFKARLCRRYHSYIKNRALVCYTYMSQNQNMIEGKEKSNTIMIEIY